MADSAIWRHKVRIESAMTQASRGKLKIQQRTCMVLQIATADKTTTGLTGTLSVLAEAAVSCHQAANWFAGVRHPGR